MNDLKSVSLETALKMLNLLDPVALFDREGRYLYVNQPWINNLPDKEKTLPYLSGKCAWEIVPNGRVKEVVATHQPLTGEIITIDGQYAYVSYVPVFDAAGRFDGVFMCEQFRGAENIYKTARDATKMVEHLQSMLDSANEDIHNLISQGNHIPGLIGESPAMRALENDVFAAARTNSTVLIEGETGTGKEVVARAIHKYSKRSTGKFVPVNCAAIPENLIESELFGYEEGAFTGAKRGGRAGKFELANNGTLFLDEIHQLSYSAQPKLLRAIQEREIERISGSRSIPINFRCIAATNVDLMKQVESRSFRSDLYYRLNVVHIKIPPLRERLEDIPLLVDHLISQLNARLETNIIMASDDALNLLMEYDWPGNIRELQNAIEAAMNRAWDGVLRPEHFRLERESVPDSPSTSYNFKHQQRDIEYTAICKALQESHGNKAEAARRLGMSRSQLYKKIEQYNIK